MAISRLFKKISFFLLAVTHFAFAQATQWWSADKATRLVENSKIKYNYAGGSFGMGIRNFINKTTGEDHCNPFDAIGTGYALYDQTPVQFKSVTAKSDYLEIEVKTGKTTKIERIYKNAAALEIQYTQMDALWLEDKTRVAGSMISMVMYGMKDIDGQSRGKWLWKESERLSQEKYNNAHNFGDTFIEANGSTVDQCTYKGHLIYGMINRENGQGIGFVFPTSINVHNWKVWWDGPNLISYEWFPYGKLHKRWIFAVTGGKPEVISVGKAIVDKGRPTVGINVLPGSAPGQREKIRLSVFPNPFNLSTSVKYALSSFDKINLGVFNALGQEVYNLFNGRVLKKSDIIIWDGRNRQGQRVVNGPYLVRLKSNDWVKTARIMVGD